MQKIGETKKKLMIQAVEKEAAQLHFGDERATHSKMETTATKLETAAEKEVAMQIIREVK